LGYAGGILGIRGLLVHAISDEAKYITVILEL
jgi:hypothetical protein